MGGSYVETGGPDPHAKSEVAIGFLRNSGLDTPVKQLDLSGPIASRGSPDGGPL